MAHFFLRRPRALTQILFGIMCALLLMLVFFRFNLEDQAAMQWAQVSMVIILMLLGWWEIRRVNRALKEMSRVADLIGGGDFRARVDHKGKDFLGLLARAINTMAERIETSMTEIEESKTQLQQSQETLERQNEELSAAFDRQAQFGEYLGDLAAIDINTLANKGLEHILRAARAQIGAFFLTDDNSDKLSLMSVRGVDQNVVKAIAANYEGEGLPAETLARKEWVFVEDIDGLQLPDIQLGVGKASIRSVYGIPVIFRGKALAVIVLAHVKKPERTTLEDVSNHIDALANGLNNALSYKAINRQSVLLEKVNQDLRQADQIRSEFVANMSHELRTPLNSIIGFSGIMMKNRSKTLDESDLKRVEKINRNGRHLLNLINDILDLSKIEAGRMELALSSVSLNSVVREVIDLVTPQADAKALVLRADIPEQEQVVEADEQKVRQVLINLMGNAVKFTKEGSVTLRLEPPEKGEGGVLFRVIDTGIGIPEEKLQTIFEAFRQADNTTTREFGGTGLGLTISQSIAALMGGSISVTSQVGQGTVFSFFLPSKAAVAAETSGKTTMAEAAPKAQKASDLLVELREALSQSLPVRAGAKILVIDDDADALELISQYLQDLGAHVVSCSDSRRAVETALAEKPELITLDLMMPEKSGWDVLSALKATPELRQIPVIIVSMVADRKRAISLGAVDALNKPIVRSEFAELIQRNLATASKHSKALIVEDDADARLLMKAWLEGHVGEIRTAQNGQDALKVLQSFRPDVLFLDLQMPVMDGFSLLQELRANPEYKNLPVIVVTAKDLAMDEQTRLFEQGSRVLLKGKAFSG